MSTRSTAEGLRMRSWRIERELVMSLKPKPRCQLYRSHGSDRGHSAERRRVHLCIDAGVLRNVENIRCLGAKLQNTRFLQRKDFGEGHIKNLGRRTDDTVAARIAVLTRRWCDECGSIEPLPNRRVRNRN